MKSKLEGMMYEGDMTLETINEKNSSTFIA